MSKFYFWSFSSRPHTLLGENHLPILPINLLSSIRSRISFSLNLLFRKISISSSLPLRTSRIALGKGIQLFLTALVPVKLNLFICTSPDAALHVRSIPMFGWRVQMTSTNYLLQSKIVLLFFYCCYSLLLRKVMILTHWWLPFAFVSICLVFQMLMLFFVTTLLMSTVLIFLWKYRVIYFFSQEVRIC